MNRIICVSSSAHDEDEAGPRIHERLVDTGICDDVELVDGRLSDLGRSGLVKGAERVVIVDTMTGFGRPGEVMVIENALGAEARPSVSRQIAGLSYLSCLQEMATDYELSEVLVVGVEPPFDDYDLDMAAEMSLGLVRELEGERVHTPTKKKGHA